VFDYIQFSKFHTPNGDDTLPRYCTFVKKLITLPEEIFIVFCNEHKEANLSLVILTSLGFLLQLISHDMVSLITRPQAQQLSRDMSAYNNAKGGGARGGTVG